MSQEQWTSVDHYIVEHLLHADEALEHALRTSAAARLPEIQVSPNQGKLLGLWVKVLGARRVLEVGTLGGYSTIWLARALAPGGLLVTLELEPAYAEIARANLLYAGLAAHVDVRVGPALDTMQTMIAEGVPAFDFVFIDADKVLLAEYFSAALALTRSGGVIVVDNVIRSGGVIDAGHADARVQGVRRMYEVVAREARVTATAVQTVGSKGYDGFAFIRVNDDR